MLSCVEGKPHSRGYVQTVLILQILATYGLTNKHEHAHFLPAVAQNYAGRGPMLIAACRGKGEPGTWHQTGGRSSQWCRWSAHEMACAQAASGQEFHKEVL